MPATDTPPRSLQLPNPRHRQRLPPQLEPEQIERVRQAAYLLPQVVAPADFTIDGAPATDEQLDQRGMVLLQKAAAGARPSRWIAPQLFDQALRHLDAVGSGRGVRARLLERHAALDTLGLRRNGDHWERLCSDVVVLGSGHGKAPWQVQVSHLVEVDADPVWQFFRDGDQQQLLAALGPPPGYLLADALREQLDKLVDQASAVNPQRMESLLPGLQAECSLPRPFVELEAGCERAFSRWANRVNELDTLEDLTIELRFQGYPDSFPLARRLGRKVTLFVGPPNSGKTHAAFERLAAADGGCYLAPLRLLALEGRDRLQARGVACSLLTGEEKVAVEGARLVSSTIEMLATRSEVQVAVIDEAQMIFDPSRGWAWTQAIVGVPAKELLIICSVHAVPAIENLLRLCGEQPEIRHFERKQAVKLLPAPVPMGGLRSGDALVAFSRRDVLMLRDQVAAEGHSVSVIYGALPPEVRRREAERFAQGHAAILVATDAIGMGLNLPIRRVLFSTLTKFDGVGDRELDESEVHQIAGRAGRYGLQEEGFAGVMVDAEPSAAKQLRELLATAPRAPRDFKAAVAPNWWHVDTIASRLGKDRLGAVLGVFMAQLQLDDAHFEVAELDQMVAIAEHLDERASRLPLRERFTYSQAPVDSRSDEQLQHFLGWAEAHAFAGQVEDPWFLDEVDEHSRLDRMEQALRACTLWLWLDLRFPGIYGQLDAVIDLRSRLNDGIERHLKGKKPLWRARGRRR
ncbi:helicase-related protein [Piscinibacter sakaiensis]|uniref:helicase-related protein n=1 Tax=Piscinibacter sakaiensis TaxID=1547922 RepID=UPI003AAAC331